MIPMGPKVECPLPHMDRIILYKSFCLEASQKFYFFLLGLANDPYKGAKCINAP